VRVLVVGGGGREHALCWKISQSPLVDKLYCAPGNGGIAAIAECVDIPADRTQALLTFARTEKIDLTVVGPEDPLVAGICDVFRAAKLAVFGPDQSAAEIEGSKALAKEICRRHKIPTPQSWAFEDRSLAMAFLENHRDEPLVIKASGLAAGKGVLMCTNYEQARAAVLDCMELKRFGRAGETIVIEEWVRGQELSALVLTDGRTIVPFEPVQDYKPVGDGNQGPNTGGMGTVSPPGFVNTRTPTFVIDAKGVVRAIHAGAMLTVDDAVRMEKLVKDLIDEARRDAQNR
jgi:phosphoribosylamine--glycine ligase